MKARQTERTNRRGVALVMGTFESLRSAFREQAESDYGIAVLSPRSVAKPWVVREMSSSLMHQLSDKGIRILPLVVESCDIPPLFVDLKYADFRTSFDDGVRDLVAAIKRAKAT